MPTLPAFTLKIAPTLVDQQRGMNRHLHTIQSVADTWQRSVALQGGDWIGKFRVSGLPLRQLVEMFNTWLGWNIHEQNRAGTWGGMVYEMELHHNLVRRVSLDPLANKVYAAYQQLIANPGLEDTAGAGTFDDWTDTIGGSDTINIEATNVARGDVAARLTYVNNGTTYISQNADVFPNTPYRVSFYSRGDGTREGRYVIRDATGGSDIVALTATGNITDKYRRVSVDIVTPASCTSVGLRLYVPSAAGSAYYDDISIAYLEDDRPTPVLTSAVESVRSQAQFGVKEIVCGKFASREDAERAAADYLQLHAFPQLERESGQVGNEPYLDVTVCGYIFTSKWQFVSQRAYGRSKLAHDLLDDLLTEWQYAGTRLVWRGSTARVTLEDTGKQTIRDGLNLITAASSSAGVKTRLGMNAERAVTFEVVSREPVYHLRGGEFYDANGNGRTPVNSRQLRPGVVRDMDCMVGGANKSSWFLDQRDFLLDEISVMADGSLRWSIAEV